MPGGAVNSLTVDQRELVVGAHATLGHQQDHSSQNQDGASHVQDRGACDDGGG